MKRFWNWLCNRPYQQCAGKLTVGDRVEMAYFFDSDISDINTVRIVSITKDADGNVMVRYAFRGSTYTNTRRLDAMQQMIRAARRIRESRTNCVDLREVTF